MTDGADGEILNYVMRDPLECNLSYIPFIVDGGFFVPTMNNYALGDRVVVDLGLPGRQDLLRVEGKVVWITPRNALHHVLPGIGIQFTGPNAQTVRTQIESYIDTKAEVGGYAYGILEDSKKDK